ncbi:CBO0543 family protein [Anaerosolibacter sp.]|uniref:CBO0543 family protein n=1 Tax=Anaerosolibacter sp. TaxID=1872527 RepID=UPI0039EE325A
MNKEYIILVIAWIITINLLIRYVPRNRSREAWLVFLFKMFLTWIFGLLVVELDMIEYPVRFFMEASMTSFTFEFFVYPAICVLFNLHYPEKKSSISQWMYYVIYCSVISIIEVILEKYTNLIIYINWEWYWTWITLLLTFYASRKFYLWFFKPYRQTSGS